MTQQLPPGQGPIDPQGAFRAPPPPNFGGMPPVPPAGFGPPPMWMPPPPPRQGRSWAGLIFGTLASLIFTGSLLLNFIWFVSAAMNASDGPPIRERTLVAGSAVSKVAVVPFNGIILGKGAERFDRVMTHVEKEAGVKALVVEVDTPGGDVSASDEMYHRVLEFKAKKPGVPVVMAMKGMATSGGYYLSCAGDYVFAEPTTITANIGVLMPRYNLQELADKWGVKDTTIKSTGSPFKDAGSMLRAETPEEKAYWQGLIDHMYKQFTGVVEKGRGQQIKGKKLTVAAVADGRAMVAQEALDKGLVDAIGYPEDAYKHAMTMAAISGASVVRYEEKSSFGDLFSAESKFGGAAKTVNGVNVNVSEELVSELVRPRLMYLWTGQ